MEMKKLTMVVPDKVAVEVLLLVGSKARSLSFEAVTDDVDSKLGRRSNSPTGAVIDAILTAFRDDEFKFDDASELIRAVGFAGSSARPAIYRAIDNGLLVRAGHGKFRVTDEGRRAVAKPTKIAKIAAAAAE